MATFVTMRFFAAALIFFGAASYAQPPQVPHKMSFSGMTLVIRDDARREIQKDVDALTQYPRYFTMKVERAKTYFPIIEKIFEEEGLPLDFKYLVLQESALVPDAISVSNAVGYWQFKDFTALEMGLRVDREVDERMNLVSATRGAARYLKKSNSFFDNWVYSLQSYQMGAGGVRRAVGEQHKGARHMDITSQTYWYVKKFIAHKVAFEQAVNGPGQTHVMLYENRTRKSVAELAQELSVGEDRLREFNKWVKGNHIPDDRPYVVMVPTTRSDADFNNLVLASSKAGKAQPRAPSPKAEYASATVVNGLKAMKAAPGETLTALAARVQVPVDEFIRHNEIGIDHVPEPGRLYFGQKKKKTAAVAAHTVKAGEDVWSVAQQYGVQQRMIRKYNRLAAAERLRVGTVLQLQGRAAAMPRVSEEEVLGLDQSEFFQWDFTSPAPSTEELLIMNLPAPEAPAAADTVMAVSLHTVKRGETLYGIAKQYSVSVMDVLAWNQLSDPAGIKPGQVLSVKTPTQPEAKKEEPKAAEKTTKTHTVKASDTLYGIARAHGITIQQLMEYNGKTTFDLRPGETLKIPPP